MSIKHTTTISTDLLEMMGPLRNWETLISPQVATILLKLSRGESLSRAELARELSATEVAAIWSVQNKHTIQPDYVRQVKRGGRIRPSRTIGSGAGAQSFYRVGEIKDIVIRPHLSASKKTAQQKVDC